MLAASSAPRAACVYTQVELTFALRAAGSRLATLPEPVFAGPRYIRGVSPAGVKFRHDLLRDRASIRRQARARIARVSRDNSDNARCFYKSFA